MKQKAWLRKIGIYVGTLVGGIVVFVLLLIIVWLLPNNAIRKNIDQSMELIASEDTGWAEVFTHTFGSELDNWTDSVMMRSAYADEQENQALQNAMSVNGYARYWHGYLVYLRPLLCLFSYAQIRYFYMFVLMILVGSNLMLIRERLSKMNAYIFLFAMCLGYVVILPFSLQFSSVFFVFLSADIVLLEKKKIGQSQLSDGTLREALTAL